jgi:hypothetical protein
LEGTSSEKAAHYRESYEKAVLGSGGQCVGSFAFLWGSKQEATPTWFGMMLPTGEQTEMLDVMKEFWTGKPPTERAPRISAFTVSGDGRSRKARITAEDPEGLALSFQWTLKEEVKEMKYAGEGELPPGVVWERIGGPSLEFDLPGPGQFRIYATVRDPARRAGTANLPLMLSE